MKVCQTTFSFMVILDLCGFWNIFKLERPRLVVKSGLDRSVARLAWCSVFYNLAQHDQTIFDS